MYFKLLAKVRSTVSTFHQHQEVPSSIEPRFTVMREAFHEPHRACSADTGEILLSDVTWDFSLYNDLHW